MKDEEVDKILHDKLKVEKMPYEIDVNTIVNNVDNTIRRKRQRILMAASIMVILVLIVSAVVHNNVNKDETSNTNIEADIVVEPEENIGIINVNSNTVYNTSKQTTCYLTDNIITLYEYYSEKNQTEESALGGMIIAKVNSLSYTNYDRKYSVNGEVEYGYVKARTIANITIEKCFSGNYEISENIEIRASGGVIEYEEYIKNDDLLDTKISSIEQMYSTYIEEGKTKIYVSEYMEEEIKLEEGKTYLMFIYPKVESDYWIYTYGNLLREYDESTNSILNNETGEYENLDELLN